MMIIKQTQQTMHQMQKKGSGVNTGDQLNNGIIVGLIGLTVFSGIAAVCLKKKRKIKKLFIFALISAMTLSGLSVKTVHAEASSFEIIYWTSISIL